MARAAAVDLLRGLVAIPSLSGQESEASEWLCSRMSELGLDSRVDEAGNAIGEIGDPGASRLIVLLGHIDTVPGEISVRIEDGEGGRSRLYGRGAVDAKGPLAAFVCAAARLGDVWAREHDLRLVVAGAVEEEAATSKGARFLKERFDGSGERVPDACVIGEPSRWHRITLGYKGRLLLDLVAERPLRHTAGPDPGLAVLGVELWQHLWELSESENEGIESPFDQLQPSLRSIAADSPDGLREVVELTAGLRLPLGFERRRLQSALGDWLAERLSASQSSVRRLDPAWEASSGGDDEPVSEAFEIAGSEISARLAFRGYEAAWRADRDSLLARSFVGAIREVGRDVAEAVRPGFVVKTGTSDMNVVAPAWRCPILAYGPGDSALDHTPDEHLELEELERAIEVLERAMRRMGAMWGASRS